MRLRLEPLELVEQLEVLLLVEWWEEVEEGEVRPRQTAVEAARTMEAPARHHRSVVRSSVGRKVTDATEGRAHPDRVFVCDFLRGQVEEKVCRSFIERLRPSHGAKFQRIHFWRFDLSRLFVDEPATSKKQEIE